MNLKVNNPQLKSKRLNRFNKLVLEKSSNCIHVCCLFETYQFHPASLN